jgi:hypothetical protein
MATIVFSLAAILAVRDGPLEKWWGGGEIEKNPCKQKMFEKKYMQTNLF